LEENSTSIVDLRAKIDSIDSKILALINERMHLVKEIAEHKRRDGKAIYIPEREKAIIERLIAENGGLLDKSSIEAIFLEIFAISRNYELPQRVALLGPQGSFTHQAAETKFGPTANYLYLDNIKSVFEAVQTKRSTFGVVPIENNQQGTVHETILALSQFDLKIIAEVSIAVHFSLASTEDDLNSIRAIYSKDIAFRQCENFIRDTFANREIRKIPVESTSKAAKLAKQDNHAAAICSHIAARTAELPILFNNIEDSHLNKTRFLVLSDENCNQSSGTDKTTLLAKLGDHPGALASFLADFHTKQINLTKIESLPARRGSSFSYWFYIELKGHEKESAIAEVLERHGNEVKSLGSYTSEA